jgi:hypothetical protein
VAKYDREKAFFEAANPGVEYHKSRPKGPSGRPRSTKAGRKYFAFNFLSHY